MTSVIAALSFGGEWQIFDKRSINTSFPSFLKKIKYFRCKNRIILIKIKIIKKNKFFFLEKNNIFL